MEKTLSKVYEAEVHDMHGLRVKQPLPATGLSQVDPFILLHHHGPHRFSENNEGLPFGPHPHRGFETVTLIYNGNIQHRDSRGYNSTIKAGGVQWMTAGMGIIHSENIDRDMQEHGGDLEIIQLWVNLPARLKSTQPKYQGFQKEDIPVVSLENNKASAQVYSGIVANTNGPVDSLTGVTLATIYLSKGADINLPVDASKTVLFYVLNGSVMVNGRQVSGSSLVDFGVGDEIHVNATEDSRILFGVADAINEPVVSHGPFVMNTQTEILQAMRDYQVGKMGVLTPE